MWASVAVAAVPVVAILTITRPLLFASIDSAVAAAAVVPVRALGALFLALVGATAAEAQPDRGRTTAVRSSGRARRGGPQANP
jgi:ABC-type Mn2+/Zn2+ transport system permease subunit